MMRTIPRRGGVVLLVGAILLHASAATAGDVTFRTTSTSILEYHWDNKDNIDLNDDYVDLVNKLNFTLQGPVLQADLRLDTFTLLPAPWDTYPKEAPPGKTYRDDYRLERLTGVLRPAKGLKITGGDFYAQFGNGIALSLRKVDELGLETVLRGGRIDGQWGLFSLTILGGVTNINNIDPQDQYFVEDPMDRLVGVRAGVRTPGGRFKLGLHGVWMRPATEDISSENTWIGGGTVDAVLVPGNLMLGFEGDFGWFDGAHHELVRLDEHTGYAFYLNLRAKMGPVSLLVEGKLYDAFGLEGSKRYPADTFGIAYNQPPTTERMDQEVDNSNSVLGGRLKLDWRILPTLSIFGNFGGGDYVSVADMVRHSDDDGNAKLLHKAQYLHAYGGLELRWSESRSSLVISGGYRVEREPYEREDLSVDWKKYKSLAHGEAKLNIFLHKDWNLHATFLHEHRTKLKLNDTTFDYYEYGFEWGTHILGIDWAGILDVSGGFEYDTDSLTPDWYGFGMVKWFIRKNLIWSVFAGTQRGGLKCVGGVCKIVPPFAGVRTELIFRY